jgi:hypothetical protein
VPLKHARPAALPAGSAASLPTTNLPSAERSATANHQGGAEQSTQPPFAISIAPPAGRITKGRPQAHRSHAPIIVPPPFAPASPSLDASAVHLERLLRRHLEELRFTFGDEPLDDLRGFLICENGNRALITAADLDPHARISLYLHCLGHLALGHVDGDHLSVSYEFRDRWRLPPGEQVREAAADAWARQLIAGAQRPDGSKASPNAIRHQLGALRLPPGFLRACLQRLHAALTADPALSSALR